MNILFQKTNPRGQLLALFLIFVSLFIIGTGVSFVPMLLGYDTTNLLSQALSQIVVFAGSAFLFAYLFHGNPVSFLQLSMPQRMGITFCGVFLVLLTILPASDWLATVNDSWHFPQSLARLEQLFRDFGAKSQNLMEGFLLRDGISDLVVNLLALAFVPAICEELFFRGALQQVMIASFRGKHHWAIILTAAIFSLMHGDLFAFLPRFLLGILLGYLFYYGRSLWVNVLAHFLNNAVVVVLYFLAARGEIDIALAESLDLPIVVVILTTITFGFFFWLFFLRKEKK